MTMQFQKATKKQSKLRLALIGPSGSGKTYTALTLATALGQRVAVIDTERGSASKYSDLFSFDVLELDTFSPLTYVEAIHAAEQGKYDVLVIDSLSHAWVGKEGALEQVDKIAKRSQSQNNFAAWRDVTPMHNALVDAMLQSPCHIVAAIRAKTEYVIEQNEKGKMAPRKIGLAPVQRDGLEYEFDVVADMDLDNTFIVSKSRCPVLHGAVINKPTKALAETLKGWLTDGATPLPPVKAEQGNGKAVPANPLAQSSTNRIDAVYQAVVDAHLAENIHDARNALKWCKTGYAAPENAVAWMRIYRACRDDGSTVKEAADLANAGELSK